MLRQIVGNMAMGDAGPKPDLDVPNNAVNQKLCAIRSAECMWPKGSRCR